MTQAMSFSQHITRRINGKVVYLFKVTDSMNTKLESLGVTIEYPANDIHDIHLLRTTHTYNRNTIE